MYCIEANGLTKTFGRKIVVNGIDLAIKPGRIVGVFGPNGAGKTTLFKAILGLTQFEGELSVLGKNPWRARDALMQDVSFVADVAVLPRWLRVSQAIDYITGVHPRFNRDMAEGFLAKTTVSRNSKVSELSKGMVAQLHLALVMAIDAKLLVLDEPTLGLDILYRKQFFDSLLHDYYDKQRTILISTHDIDEVQHILTDAVFVDGGRIVLSCEMTDFESQFFEVNIHPDQHEAARALSPIHERHSFGRSAFLYRGVELEQLAELGEVRTPALSDVFLAVVTNQAATNRRANA
jgi:ABC-2 type transport system ATP-binding protein